MSQGPVDTGRTYACIDLKSFYASVECVERGLDPLVTNLVVADPTRGRGTICLAITPAMKALGIKNRCRVFQIPPGVDYLTAPPRMHLYMERSAQIYGIYLRHVSAEDVHVYSIDECFIDMTPYLPFYRVTPRQLARRLMDAVFAETGICATAGIGTNLFLAKVALDVTAKHAEDGIGFLDEAEFKRLVWHHRPITDIWNVGPGIAARLERYGVHDLAGVAAMDESLLYREFGVNAEYLIDHAHGREPCTIAQIKAYRPAGTSLCNGQVLMRPYSFDEALVVLKEMIDESVLELVRRHVVCNHVSVHVGYDVGRDGLVVPGRRGMPYAGTSRKLCERTNSRRKLMRYVCALYRRCVDPQRAVRRLSIGFAGLVDEHLATVTLFTDERAERREHSLAETTLAVKRRFGKNALVKGMSFLEGATGRERNLQIGGHRA